MNKNENLDNIKNFFAKNEKLIYTPGPTMVPPRILRALSKQIINPDLDPDFPSWLLDTIKLLGKIIKQKTKF